MMRRYLVLLAISLVAAGALMMTAKSPRRAAEPAPATSAPVVALALAIQDGSVSPTVLTAPKDCEVQLTVENHGRSAAALALAGYEDRLAIPALAPGETWRGAFTADRPGEDFAWLLDGRPVGRFEVRGSHLIEGHR